MKRTFILVVIVAMVLVCSMQAHSALQNLGTDSLGNRLIYDTDLNITWYDYTKSSDIWQNQVNWADALSVTFGSNTYTDWRLPTALNQNGSGPCGPAYNCTGSEMGHLYFAELGNVAPYTGCTFLVNCGLVNVGYFQNLQPHFYWSGTKYDTDGAWFFGIDGGVQGYANVASSNVYAVAVRPGLAVVPEPMSMVLFGIGGVVLAARRKLLRRRG